MPFQKARHSQAELDQRLINRNLIIEANKVLKNGGLIAALLGISCGILIFIMIALNLIENVLLPAVMAVFAGSYSLIIFFLSRKNRMRGWLGYLIFLPYISIPTFFFIASHFFLPGGAATYITGPFSYLYFFLIIMTGFMYDTRLARSSGYIAGLGYLISFFLARPGLTKLTGADPTLIQDITDVPLYFFKSVMMVFAGYTVGALSNHSKKLIYKVLNEEREKQSVSKLFGQFVSPEVMEKVIAEKQTLIGETKQVAVLFSDICSFTAFSENKSPEEIVNHLNRYFDGMVEAITSTGGVVDKFIGDAIMAVFGGLMELPNPCESALRAAIRMRQKLSELNRELEKEGLQTFDNGIGIHFGEVLQGPLGSSERKEFTVIGDAVNTASRVEGLTRNYDYSILITESVYRCLPEYLSKGCVEQERVRVKGKEKEILIYGLPSAFCASGNE